MSLWGKGAARSRKAMQIFETPTWPFVPIDGDGRDAMIRFHFLGFLAIRGEARCCRGFARGVRRTCEPMVYCGGQLINGVISQPVGGVRIDGGRTATSSLSGRSGIALAGRRCRWRMERDVEEELSVVLFDRSMMGSDAPQLYCTCGRLRGCVRAFRFRFIG
jgi:hypothetical protein